MGDVDYYCDNCRFAIIGYYLSEEELDAHESRAHPCPKLTKLQLSGGSFDRSRKQYDTWYFQKETTMKQRQQQILNKN